MEDGRHHGRGPQLPGLRGSRGKGDSDGETFCHLSNEHFLKPTKNIVKEMAHHVRVDTRAVACKTKVVTSKKVRTTKSLLIRFTK